MNKVEWVRQAVEQHLSDIRTLLAMRLLFPPEQSVVSIDKEILDLYQYPERLESSYRDEWQAIALKALYKHGFADPEQTDQDNLSTYLDYLCKQAIPGSWQRHAPLFSALNEILAIQRASNTLVFPHAGKRAALRRARPAPQGKK